MALSDLAFDLVVDVDTLLDILYFGNQFFDL